jgi:hypothetical protein
MANSSSLLKTLIHKTIAEGLFKEIISRTSKYYYFLGKTLAWDDETNPQYPVDSFQYEKDTRNEIITLKEIKPSDVAYVVVRNNWISGLVYDIYDDRYCTQVEGISITNGGQNYTSLPTLTISAPNVAGGTQATATAITYNNELIGAVMLNKGSGYTNPPTITITGGGAGSGAVVTGVINKSANGYQKLEDSKFYVVTDEYNVYKCLDNNNNAKSIYKPIGTQVLPIILNDGYVWKYLYNVPIALRTKFLTDNYMPVVNALTQQFYSSGGIETVVIENRGTGYTTANLNITGDGYLESDPLFLTSVISTNVGSGYVDGDTVLIAAPYEANPFNASAQLYQGNKLYSGDNIYEVVQAGISSSVAPTHFTGTAANGTAALKFIGTTAKGIPSFNGSGGVTVTLLGGVKDVNITASGSGYNSNPTITFSSPEITFGSSNVNTSSNVITLGTHWFQTGDQVVYISGGTDINPLTSNTVYYVIRISSTSIKLATSSGNATAGTAVDITTTGPASGQIIRQYHTFTAGSALLSSTGQVKRIVITNPGNNYTTAPLVTIGTEWTASTVVTVGQQYFVSSRLYTVTVGGTTGSTAPVGSALGTSYTDGTATLKYVGAAAKASSSLRFGAGYFGNPTLTISSTTGTGFSATFASAKSEAKLLPILESGQIVGVQVDDAGVGYSSASISVGGDGTGAVVTADLNLGNINSLQANNELLTVDGTINNIIVVSPGYNYGTAPIAINGDGIGATAVATIDGGRITKITMTNQGSGYTYANIVIGGNGSAALARAIIAPKGGHGKDGLQELFARTLMFYSNVSKDKNQGFDVNNDYRQVGVIKNLRKFGETTRFSSSLGSACFVIAGNINLNYFTKDMLLTTPRSVGGITFNKRFRIVSVNTSGALIQSLDNDAPNSGDVMYNENSQFFSVAAVNAPTVDKYSGDLLYIDNKAGFTPSADETVTLRTVIKF